MRLDQPCDIAVPDYRAAAGRRCEGSRRRACRRNTSPTALDPRIRRRCDAAARRACARSAPTVREVSLPHTSSRFPSTTSSRPPRRRRTSRASTACGTDSGSTGDGLRGMYEATRSRRLRPRGQAPHPARHLRALGRLLRRLLPARRRQVRALIARRLRPASSSAASTCCSLRRRRPPRSSSARSADPYEMYLCDIFTVTANLAGIPAMSVPIGRVDGLPVGGQFLADALRRSTRCSRAAYALERALGARTRMTRRHAPTTGRWSSGSRCTSSSRRARSSSAAARPSSARRPTRTPARSASALPGALPVLNEHAVELAARAALALGCTVHADVDLRAQELLLSGPAQGLPDLAVRPAARDRGWLEIGDATTARDRASASRACTWRRTRASRSTIGIPGATAIDLNRAGVPLIEIVSEPDIRSRRRGGRVPPRAQADPRVPRGQRRATWRREACASTPTSARAGAATTTLGTKTEVKNMNSFSRRRARARGRVRAAVSRVLEARRARRAADAALGRERGEVRPARRKEESHDYRYFPEPDLPPLVPRSSWIEDVSGRRCPSCPRRAARDSSSDYGLADVRRRRADGEPRRSADYFEARRARARRREGRGELGDGRSARRR